jgi:hypothetical protein
LKGVLEEGKPWLGAGFYRFALFEADRSGDSLIHTPGYVAALLTWG